MKAHNFPDLGSVGWIDLTVADAEGARDFYSAVVGWSHGPVDMGGYADFNMAAPGNLQPQAGICHARGANEGVPPTWMIYIRVWNLNASLAACTKRGGTVIRQVRKMSGSGRYAMIQDPQGAVCALFEPT